jgi:hypothetical protein
MVLYIENTQFENDPLFFQADYLTTVNKNSFKSFVGKNQQESNLQIIIDDSDVICTSMSMSLFGSFLQRSSCIFEDFDRFVGLLSDHLRAAGKKTLKLIHPASCYDHSVPLEWLEKTGFKKILTSDNQHIDLQNPRKFHNMELRKLKTLKETHQVRRLDPSEFINLHQFITKCRGQQNLEINIDQTTLLNLVSTFPNHYEGWVSELDGQWTSAVLMVRVTKQLVYYYLPATDKVFKSASPMVQLIDHLISYYQNNGFSTLDMGVSSINGVRQKGLFDFKERMGAICTPKYTFQLNL